ncbi:MAG: hypothetical protein ACI3YH_02160 [Eubacteriales bacterium]
MKVKKATRDLEKFQMDCKFSNRKYNRACNEKESKEIDYGNICWNYGNDDGGLFWNLVAAKHLKGLEIQKYKGNQPAVLSAHLDRVCICTTGQVCQHPFECPQRLVCDGSVVCDDFLHHQYSDGIPWHIDLLQKQSKRKDQGGKSK